MRFLVEGVGACEVGKTADGGRNRSLVQERVPEVRGTTVIKEKQNATALPLHTAPATAAEHGRFAWPKYRFRSGPPQILISKFRGAAANFEVDFDCQNTSVLPQDRAYRRRTPTQDIPPLNRTRSPPHETRLERAGAHMSRHLVAWGVWNATGGARGPLSAACAAHRHAGAQTSRLCPLARPFCRERAPAARKRWLAP